MQTFDNGPVSVPVHANSLKTQYDPNVSPIEDFCNSSYLTNNDLPSDSFDNGLIPEERAITRSEETHTPLEIKNYLALPNQEV